MNFLLTSTTRLNVAALPARRTRPPHAVVLPRCLSGPKVSAGHLPRLETVATAGGGARRPRSDAPLKKTCICGTVLQRAGPSNTHTWWRKRYISNDIMNDSWLTCGVQSTVAVGLWCRLCLGSKHGGTAWPNRDPHTDRDTRSRVLKSGPHHQIGTHPKLYLYRYI